MSQAGASLLVVAVMLVLAVYFLLWPPPGFDENIVHRIAIPFLLVAGAFGVMENIRTRTHMAQLIGAIRSLLGKSGAPPTPEVKAEAVEILLQSLKSDQPRVRTTAAQQLKNLTGQDFGEDFDGWNRWWADNKNTFKKAP